MGYVTAKVTANGMSNAEAAVKVASGIEAVASIGVAFWANDMDQAFLTGRGPSPKQPAFADSS